MAKADFVPDAAVNICAVVICLLDDRIEAVPQVAQPSQIVAAGGRLVGIGRFILRIVGRIVKDAGDFRITSCQAVIIIRCCRFWFD